MCGRFVVAQDVDTYTRFFGVDEVRTEVLERSYNVAPTDRIYAIAAHDRLRLLGTFRWGLIPLWATNQKRGHINARAETLAEKPAFGDAFRRRRCIIPADGFYEWQRQDRGKLPHFIYRRDGAPMALAGLWSRWRDPVSGDAVSSAAIVTMDAHPSLASIHGRMPVMLETEMWDAWLDPAESNPDRLRRLLVPDPETAITHHTVSTLVNDVRNNLPECIVPLPPPPAAPQPRRQDRPPG